RELPPGCHVAGRILARLLLDQLDAVVEDRRFLLPTHRNGIFVTVAVYADFMAGCDHLVELFRERLDRVAGPEPGGWEVVFLQKVVHAWDSHLSGEHAARDVVRRVFTTVRAQPAADCVD